MWNTMNPFNTMKHKHTLVLGCSTLKSKADPRKGSGGDVLGSGVCFSRDKMAAPQTSFRTSHMGMSKPQENSVTIGPKIQSFS